MEKLTQPSDNAISNSTTRKSEDDDLQDSASSSQRPNKTTKRRYSRSHLLKLNEDVKLKDPPDGYNPAVLTYRSSEGVKETSMKDSGPPAKWNRSPSLGANWQGGGGRGSRNQSQYSRLIEGVEDPNSGPNAIRGRALRSAVSWHEDRSGTTPPERTFSRKNSRSDGPGRWDNNKDEISGSLEKRPSQGPERWPSYGHRDMKEKHQKAAREDFEETEELFPPPPGVQQYHHHHGGDQDPPWMHHQEARNSEKVEQHRKSAAEFEQKRKQMRETLAKEKKDGNGGENAMFMTDEEINKYKKELEAEERGISSSSAVYTFDSLKEALKSQGVSNLPPMPTSGMNTVDQIEKSMKATAAAAQPTTVSEIDRQKLELLKLASGGGPGGNLGQTGASGGGNMEGANLLLSMLRGQNRPPPGASGVLHPNHPVAGQLGPYAHLSLQQQQQLLASAGGTPLERLFTNNQRTTLQPNVGNLGLGFGGGSGGGGGQTPQQQQPIGLPPGLGTVNIPYMQQANPQGQLNPRGGGGVPAMAPPGAQQNPLFSALIANQAQQSAQQRVKQAQMMAHLKQAQQAMALPHSRPMQGTEQDFGMNNARSASTNANERDTEKEVDPTGNPPNAPPPVQNQIPLHSFGLAGQGGFMGSRPQIPAVGGMINPAMIGGGVQPGLFQGGGLGAHPGLFMQNGGGGLGRPTGPPGLNPLAFTGMRPNPEIGGLMESRQAQMSLLGMQQQQQQQQNPGMNLQASMLAQQQGTTSGLNRFFGMTNLGAGTAPSFPPTGGTGGPGGGEPNPPTAGNEAVTGRGRSLEELKNEAQ